MRRAHWFGALALVAMLPIVASADTLRDKINRGAEKTANFARKTAQSVDQTVDSTVALAKGEGSPEATRAKLDQMADATLARLFAETPGAAAMFDASAGYAVFDTRRSVLLGVAAGFGRGVAVSRPDGARTYMRMATGGVGLAFGIGGFESQIVILFETPVDFQRFVINGYDASAEAGAQAGNDKAGESLRFVQGQSFFVLGKKGWRVNAVAAGTRYWPDPVLGQVAAPLGAVPPMAIEATPLPASSP